MAAGSSKTNKKLERQQRAFIAHIRSAHASGSTAFYDPAPHRTWPWYVLMLSQELEQTARPRKPNLSASREAIVAHAARQIMSVIRSMFREDAMIPNSCVIVEALNAALPTALATERLTHYLIAELKLNLTRAFEAEGERSRPHGLAPLSRRSARSRSELPDPTKPAWSPINRMPSKKVQIPCRIDPEIKTLIEGEAEKLGVSQSRWLEEAIFEKLQRQGHGVELPKVKMLPPSKPRKPRRVQRPSVPVPDKSVDASINRADKSTTTRMGEALAAQIDKARGKQDRSAWMNEAIVAFLGAKARLPAPPNELEELSEPFAIRFDRDFFPEIVKAAQNSGVTRSEWYRGVARWYLEQ